jgi:hypothetical protein
VGRNRYIHLYMRSLHANSEKNALHMWPQITILDLTSLKKDKKGKKKETGEGKGIEK